MDRSLFDKRGRRKYLVPSERTAFLRAALREGGALSTFCVTLVFTGARVTEVLQLTPEQLDEANQTINFETLKRRKRAVIRAIPVPGELFRYLDDLHAFRLARQCDAEGVLPLWPISRSTAWRWVAHVGELAGIPKHLCNPRALRHSFSVEARLKGVPLELIQELLGHARIETTMIYTKVIGHEQRDFVGRTWHENLELLRFLRP